MLMLVGEFNEMDLLLEGYKRFYTKHFVKNRELYETLAIQGQFPKILVVSCSDSRVDPYILMDANPGDIFVIRNVANIVPPYQPNNSYHGTSAALEFAVNNLQIEHIVVLGHSGCAGIRALLDDNKIHTPSFLQDWINIVQEAKERTLSTCCQHVTSNKYQICEQESIIISIKNLLTFPWIQDKVNVQQITLHGWYFSLYDGKLFDLSKDQTYVEV